MTEQEERALLDRLLDPHYCARCDSAMGGAPTGWCGVCWDTQLRLSARILVVLGRARDRLGHA